MENIFPSSKGFAEQKTLGQSCFSSFPSPISIAVYAYE